MPLKVREVIRLLERNGWKEIRAKGSHRHFKHPDQPGLITVPGKAFPGVDLNRTSELIDDEDAEWYKSRMIR